MTTRDLIAGAVAFPVVVALTFVEPALGLVVGFAVFAGVQKTLKFAAGTDLASAKWAGLFAHRRVESGPSR